MSKPHAKDPVIVRWTLTVLALAALGLFIVLPLAAVFVQAFEKGWQAYRDTILQPETVSAIELSLLALAISVPMNTLFGLAAAWAITKFQFIGKNVLTSSCDCPAASTACRCEPSYPGPIDAAPLQPT